jgi:hypothetical protein
MKAITEASNARQTGQKLEGENRGLQQKEIDQIARNLSQNPTDENIQASKDIIQKSSFYSPEAKTRALAAFDRALQIPLTERGSYFGMQGATAGDVARANRPIAVGGSLMSPTGQTIANAPTKPANAFAPLNPKDYTPESIRAFVASQNPADLIAAAPKPANAFAPINVKDYTPESLKAYGLSGQVSDLVPVPPKAANLYAPIVPKDYTPESLKAYGLSGQASDLIPVAAKADKPASLINQIDPSKFTPASVAKFSRSQDYADLEPVAAKADKPASLVNQIDASKFTPSSVAAFSAGGDYSLLVPVVSATKADRTIANVNPNDFTPKSLDKYLISGKYADLVPVAKTSGGEGGGAGGAAGTGTIEVVNPKDPTKTIVVTKARAVAEGLTPAKAMEGLTPVQRQKLEASYPVATTALKGHQNKTAQFIKDLKKLRDHPGLDSVTGFAAGRAPGLTDAGRSAVADYEKVVAKGGFQALQDMRDMSKTGGALGNVSDKENQQLKASFAAIDRKQNAKDVRAAIDDLIKELEGGVGRLQDAYDLTYEYRTGRTAPAASGVDANNPLLK